VPSHCGSADADIGVVVRAPLPDPVAVLETLH